MEILAILSAAKEAGVEAGSLIAIASSFFAIKNILSKQNDENRKFIENQNNEFKKVVTAQVDKVVEAINHHNEKFADLETGFVGIRLDVDYLKKNAVMRADGKENLTPTHGG